MSKSAEPPVHPSAPYSRVTTLFFSDTLYPDEAERTRIPSLRGVGLAAWLSDLTVMSFTSAPWTVTSPCITRILRVPGFDASENAIWLAASSARAAWMGASASAAARMRGQWHSVIFMILILKGSVAGSEQVDRAARRVAHVGVGLLVADKLHELRGGLAGL